jgi:hypothetical protein
MPRKAAEPPRGFGGNAELCCAGSAEVRAEVRAGLAGSSAPPFLGWDIRIDGFRGLEGSGIWRPGSGGEAGRMDGLGNDSSPRRLQMLQKANVFNQ